MSPWVNACEKLTRAVRVASSAPRSPRPYTAYSRLSGSQTKGNGEGTSRKNVRALSSRFGAIWMTSASLRRSSAYPLAIPSM